MPREPRKCREWEKERRDRLSNSFSNLGKRLPCYQPSLNLSKIDILQKAINYIEELEVQIKEFVDKNATKISCEKIKKLRDQIKKLLLRNEQLCNLLKDAGIRFPAECGTIKFKSPKKWANKISPEQAKALAEKEAQKENQSKPQKKTVEKPKKLKSLTAKQKASVKRKERKKIIQSAFRLNIAQTNLLSIANSQSCFIITNAASTQSNVSKTTTVLTNSRIFSTPLVAAGIKQSGTLYVANTNILPMIHQPIVPTLLTNSNPLLLNSGLGNNNFPTILTNTPIIVNNGNNIIQQIQANAKSISTSLSVISTTNKASATVATSTIQDTSKPATKMLPLLRPKAYTCTTQINKVPIPALSSEYNKALLYNANLNMATKVGKKKDGNTKNDKKVVVTQNIVLSKSNECKIDDPGKTDEKVDKDVEEIVLEKVAEPPEKKIKLDENIETKKASLTYSIDALCNDASETNKEEVNNAEVNNTEDNNTEINKTEVNNTELNNTEVNNTDVNNTEVNNTDVNDTEVNSTEVKVQEVTEQNEAILPEVTEDKQEANKGESPKIIDNIIVEKKQKEIIEQPKIESKLPETVPQKLTQDEVKTVEIPEPLHSELSNDIFASLSQVAAGGQNPESTSPTAAFLLAFPLVSSLNSLKVTEVIEDEATESQHGTPTLLQIGTMDTTKTTQSHTDTLTPNLLNLDNFTFFSKEFYPNFDSITTTVETLTTNTCLATPVTSNNNNNNNNSINSVMNITAEVTKGDKDNNKFEFLPKLQKTITTTSQVYSIAKSEAITYTTASLNKENPKPVNKDVQQNNNYVTSNVPYTQSFFNSKNDTISSTIAEKPIDKTKDAKKPCYYLSSTAYSVPTTSVVTQYNTFNPFTDIPIKSTSSYITPKPINEMLYTNNTNYTYTYSDNFNYSKPPAKTDKIYYGLNYENYDYKNPEFQKYDNRNQQYCYNTNQNQKHPTTAVKNNNNNVHVRPPVNWMTTPDVRPQDFPPIPKDMEFPANSIIYTSNSFGGGPQSTYFNTNAPLYPSTDFHNTPFPSVPPNSFPTVPPNSFPTVPPNSFPTVPSNSFPTVPPNSFTTVPPNSFPTVPPNSFQRNDVEENQFSWSPSKLPQLLDQQQHSLVSNTLPTLVGDLALGTNQTIFGDQKAEKRGKEAPRRSKVQNFDSQNTFLSVSQLVDHNKNDGVPSRVSNRRSSGNRSSKQTPKPQKKVAKTELPKEIPNYPKDVWNEKNIKYDYQHNNWNKNRGMKNPSSNYSAESLIGHQNQKNQSYPPPVVNKSLPVPFLPENLLPYFTPVDIPQDNLIQQNQNFQGTSFTHNFPANGMYPNNSFVPNPITTSYLPSANFISDIPTDYNTGIMDNFGLSRPPEKFNKPKNNPSEREEKRHAVPSNSCSLNTPKKSKKKQSGEAALPGLVDFSFLPMPGAINSPILPDDFHSHTNFLPPPTPSQLYPCKNPLYAKQPSELGHNSLLPLPSVSRSGVPHPEISPSLNSMSSSVSNFNLSTIFPEINKGSGAIMDMYAEINKP